MTTVYSSLASSAPVSMASAANGKVYVVNGLARGVVVAGSTAFPLGVTSAPTFSAASVTVPKRFFVSGVRVIDGGENYRSPPAVSIAGVGGAKATLIGDSVAAITITTSATTHAGAPSVAFASGAQASNATVHPIMRGHVAAVMVAGAAYYSSPPDITFTAAPYMQVLRPAAARGVLTYSTLAATSGTLASVVLTDFGLYEWNGATGPSPGSAVGITATASAALAGTATLTVDASAVVSSATILSAGSEYATPPRAVFTATGPGRSGGGASAVASLNGTTSIGSVAVVSGGNGYEASVSLDLVSEVARASVSMAPRLSGKFLLGIRLVASDGTPGNFGDLMTLDCKDQASDIAWTLSGVTLSDGSPNRVSHLELWRTSSDQAITLYRVASLNAAALAALPSGKYTDSLPDFMLTDPDRADYDELPILTADGYSYANRFGIPSADMSVVTLHQSRAWYAVDSTGAKPNSVYFSSIDEFESVSADNELVVENVGREADVITGLMPMDGVLYVGKQRSLVRVTSGDEPLLDAAAVPAAQRGMLNDRCWDQFDGVAYIADSAGVYSFTGSASESLSDAISTYWTDPVIDFSKSKWFFVRVNAKERVARFYFTKTSHQYPQSALCYSLITKAWWLEEYAVPVSCGVRAVRSGQQAELLGGTGRMLTPGGTTDNGTAIPYSLKTGNFPLNDDPKRAVRVTYSPTASSHAVGIRMYYNNSSAPRANAIASDRGTGIVTTTGSTEATLDLSASRSPLGEANGFAQASFSGRLDDRSAGSDRHLAVELAGTQDAVTPVIHRLDLEGVG